MSPRFVYADASRPGWVDGFTRKTFIAMVEGAAEPALRLGLIDKGPGMWASRISSAAPKMMAPSATPSSKPWHISTN